MQILPNAKSQFIDQNGLPLASGTVGFYFPGTLNPKPTYQDAAGTIANTNPVTLDSRGQALIWGSGVYRQIVKDASGVTIWDQVTEDANSGLIGNITDAKFVSGTDFTPGVTTSLTLPVAPGAIANTWIHFDAAYQADDQIASLVGTALTFTNPIPVGVQEVNVKIGTTIAIGTPGAGTITDSSVASNAAINASKLSFLQTGAGAVRRTVLSKEQDTLCVLDFGAKGDGITDDTAAINSAIAAAFAREGAHLWFPAGNYLIKSTINIGNGSNTAPSTLNGLSMMGISAGAVASEVTTSGAPVTFTWGGADGGTMCSINGPIYGLNMHGFTFDCANIAANGIVWNHPIASRFEEILTTNYKNGWGLQLLAYQTPTGCVVGASNNTFIGVHAKHPGAAGQGFLIGADTASVGALDVARNTFIGCEWERDGTDAVAVSMELRFCDNMTFVECHTHALGGTLGIGMFIKPPTGNLDFPLEIAFINCPIEGGVVVDSSWTTTVGIGFFPYPTGDGEPIPVPPQAGQLYGYTSSGQVFGFAIGQGGARISAHFSNTANLTFGSITGGTSSEQSIAVQGAAIGDTVVVGYSGTPQPAGFVLSGYVNGPNSVAVRWTNAGTASQTPAAAQYRADVWKH